MSIGPDISRRGESEYDDGTVRCSSAQLTIRGYYPWGPKTIPYSAIQGFSVLPLRGASWIRRWRLWGTGDFIHWWNRDLHRGAKDTALVLDIGGHIRPTITPDNPQAVGHLLTTHTTP